MRRQSLIAAVVAGAALLAAGCGGSDSSSGSSSDTSSATEWAGGVCTAITTWKSSMSAIGDTLKGGNLSQGSLTSAADDAKSATDTLTSDLGKLGTPDTDSGQKAKESLDQLSSDLTADMTKIQDALDSASGLTGIISAVSVVSSTAVTMGNQVSATFSTLQALDAKGELESAFKQASSCDTLLG
jgi:hypothetical protein